MRLRTAIALSLTSAAFGASLVACFDLFHSTSGILDACELDAEACDAGGPVDFCEWEAGMPQAAAGIACTWLSTCERASQYDDFGECMIRALLAYDCTSNPNNPVSGATKQKWLDLLRATNCDDVDRVVFGGNVPTCPEAGVGCDGLTRVICPGAGERAYGENCAMWSQTCRNVNCTGCVGCFSDNDAATCSPDASVTCDEEANIATSCPNGALETINCQELLLQAGTCNPGVLKGQDPTSPCYLDAGDASSGCVETCMDNRVTTCTRGVPVPFDCSSIDAGCDEGGAAACAFSQ